MKRFLPLSIGLVFALLAAISCSSRNDEPTAATEKSASEKAASEKSVIVKRTPRRAAKPRRTFTEKTDESGLSRRLVTVDEKDVAPEVATEKEDEADSSSTASPSPFKKPGEAALLRISGQGAGQTRSQASLVKCTNNLKGIFVAAMEYAAAKNQFPHASSSTRLRAFHSLNVLLNSSVAKSLTSKLFVCPSSFNRPARPSTDGKIVLGARNSSYAWTAHKLSPANPGSLAACTHHVKNAGVVLVLGTDGAVKKIDAAELDPANGHLPSGLSP